MNAAVDIQICNHNYLLADASHRLNGQRPLLQDCGVLIVDEAHIGSDCLPVDCDNDHTEDPAGWKMPEDVMEAFPGVTFAIHYSRFHMREKNGKPARPKFHVLFPIDYMHC